MTNPAMPNLVKIGFSLRDPKLRANELAGTGVPHPYRVAYEALVIDPRDIESKVHSELKSYHDAKEFFRCGLEVAVQTIRSVVGKQGIFYENFADDLLGWPPPVESILSGEEAWDLYEDVGTEPGYGWDMALPYLKRAVELKEINGMLTYAGMLKIGDMVQKNVEQSAAIYNELTMLTKKKAQNGDGEAQRLYASGFEYGWSGAINHAQALYWYIMSANSGDAFAASKLVDIYTKGQLDQAADAKKAAYWNSIKKHLFEAVERPKRRTVLDNREARRKIRGFQTRDPVLLLLRQK